MALAARSSFIVLNVQPGSLVCRAEYPNQNQSQAEWGSFASSGLKEARYVSDGRASGDYPLNPARRWAPCCGARTRVGYFCVTTVSIVCTIKAPVPVQTEDNLDPPYLHGR